MSQVYEEDVLDAGKNQVIVGNDDIKVVIVPESGGRIADVHSGEVKFLHRTYPEGVDFGPYTEYGGIEECMGGAPGSLWNAKWRWDEKDNGVLLQCVSRSILVRKFVTLDEAEPIVRIDYSFLNFGNNFSRFTFGVHPEVCIGGSLKDNRYHIPIEGELLAGGYVAPGFKNKVPPSEGWCAITCDGKTFGQMFPEGVVDLLEIYYPRVDTHMLLEPIILGVGVSPDKCAGFTYMIYVGDGDAEKIREIRTSRDAELSIRYESFDRAEIPGDLMSELEDRLEREAEAGVRGGFPGMPGIPGIPKVKIPGMPGMPKIPGIPDVGAIIEGAVTKVVEKALGNISPAIGADFKLAPEPGATGRTEDLSPGTEVTIEHLKGDITLHAWERPYIEYAHMRGNIEQRAGVVRLETTGDYSLNIPREVSNITLNFVKGSVSLSDVASSLKITGVKGRIDVLSAEVPNDGTLDISLVKGDINVRIPGDSSCSISASLIGGEITCDLPLQEEERTRTQLSGVLNDGTAKITLNAVKGKISVSQVEDA